MAKYSDYVEKANQDNLQDEIDNAAEQQEHREQAAPDNAFEMPERFRGKSPEEIARSYAELEKAYSRQGQDIGQLRKAVDELVSLESQRGAQEETPQEAPVTVDDLYDNTEDAIGRVAEKRVSSRIEKLEQELAQARVQVKMEQLDAKFPGWKDQAQTPEFANWLAEAPYRARLAAAADQYDMDAAEELLGLYYDQRGINQEAQERRRDEQLRQASLESSSPSEPRQEHSFSRAELLELRIAAKRGDAEAQSWLNKNREAIAIAYEEGRVTD